ncbi:MAG: protein kinase [Gemmataceae bacterium]|nr:protein kinase [Gemmataceae bacterium]
MTDKQKALLAQLGISKGKLSRQQKHRFKNFEARRQAILDAIDRIPDNKRTGLRDKVKSADGRAKKGEFKEAYEFLEKAESKARAEANGYADTFTATEVKDQVDSIVVGAREAEMRLLAVDSHYQALIAEIKTTQKASSFATLEEAALYLKDFPAVEQDLRDKHAKIRRELANACNLIQEIDLAGALSPLRVQLRVVRDSDPKLAAQLTAKLAKLPLRLVGTGTIPPIAYEIHTSYNTQVAAVEAALRDVKDLGKWQVRDAGPGPANPRLLKAIAKFQAQQDQRVAEVEKRLEQAQKADAGQLAVTKQRPPQAAPPDTFKVSDFVAALPLPKTLKNVAPDVAKKLIAQAENLIDFQLDQLIAGEPDGDELFDLALKTPAQLQAELAKSLGIDPGSPSCGADEKALLDGMAQAIAAKVQAKHPNKANAAQTTFTDKFGETSTAPQDFTLGGATFGQPKYLSSGGLGHVLRYEDQKNPGQFVVLKTLKNLKQREDMVHELRMHRQASGAGHPNVVGFKGVVFDANGVPYLAMENAAGGSVEDLGQAVGGAAAAGALTEEARHVFTQHMLRQAVTGLAHVQATNLVHRDIKPENYLLSEDGAVKVADFGSARAGDAQGNTVGSPLGTTEVFAAPDHFMGGAVTGKADTYSLGAMMAAFAGPHQGIAEILQRGGKAFRSPASATAFDRLRNAMLDDNPDKRPTLEAVQRAVYFTDAEENYDPDKVQALVTATMAYARNLPKAGREAQEKLLVTRGKIVNEERKKAKATTPAEVLKCNEDLAKLRAEEDRHRKDLHVVLNDEAPQKLNKTRAAIAQAKQEKAAATDPAKVKEIDATIARLTQKEDRYQKLINKSPIKPFVEALEKASADLEKGGEDEHVDPKTLKFADAFKKAMAAIDSPYVESEILEELVSVDEAQDPSEKRLLILRALRVLDGFARWNAASRKGLLAGPASINRQQAEKDYADRFKELVDESTTTRKALVELSKVLNDLDNALAKETAASKNGSVTGADYGSLGPALSQALGQTAFAQDPLFKQCLNLFLFLDPVLPTEDKVEALSEARKIAGEAQASLAATQQDLKIKTQNMATRKQKEAGVQAALAKAQAAAELALKESEVSTVYRKLQGQLRAALQSIADAQRQ